jgi:alpha-N-arabinofuranosidase
MANLAQLVNVIAPIFTNEKGLFLQPIYFPILEYGKQKNTLALDALVTSPTYQPAGRKALGYLDVSTTWNPQTRIVSLNVLNRSERQDISTRIDNVEGRPAGSLSVWEMNYTDLKATHTFGDDRKVVPATKTAPLSLQGNGFTYTFPKHSLTILQFRLEQ